MKLQNYISQESEGAKQRAIILRKAREPSREPSFSGKQESQAESRHSQESKGVKQRAVILRKAREPSRGPSFYKIGPLSQATGSIDFFVVFADGSMKVLFHL